jgi:hypothetical protein
MSLFGPSIPKGITKSEIPLLRGRLLSGNGTEQLSKLSVERIMELVDMSLDSDTYAERANNVELVDTKEAEHIEKLLADDLTSPQRAFVHKVFTDFVAHTKTRSIF